MPRGVYKRKKLFWTPEEVLKDNVKVVNSGYGQNKGKKMYRINEIKVLKERSIDHMTTEAIIRYLRKRLENYELSLSTSGVEIPPFDDIV